MTEATAMATTLPDDIFLPDVSPAAVGMSVTVAVVTCPPMVWTCCVVIGVESEPTADSYRSLAMAGRERESSNDAAKFKGRGLTLEDGADEGELADRLDVCRILVKT